MGVVSIILDWIFVLINATTMFPCSRVYRIGNCKLATGTQKTLKPVAVGNNVSTNNIEIALLAMLL